MPSGQDYANRIREQAHQALVPQLSGLGEELRSLRDTLSASIQRLEEKLESIRQMELPVSESILKEAIAEANEEVIRQRDLERVSLAHFAHDMRFKETQEEILALLLDEANRFAPRVALFILREDRLVGWSSRAFSEGVARKVSSTSISQTESPFLQRALLSEGLTSSADLSGEPRLAPLFQDEASGPWHAFPLRAIQRPVAVLLTAAAETCRCDLESLCLIMGITGLCIENLALKILQDMGMAAPPRAGQRKEAAAPPALEPAALAEAAAEPAVPSSRIAAEEPPQETPNQAELPAEPVETPVGPPEQPAVAAEPALAAASAEAAIAAAVGVPAVETPFPQENVAAGPAPTAPEEAPVPEIRVPEPPHAAAEQPHAATEEGSAPEIQVAESPAAVAEQPPAAPVEASAPEIPVEQPAVSAPVAAAMEATPQTPEPPPLPSAAPEPPSPFGFSTTSEAQRISEEEKLHADAKRFARLLVSEIKLYNEQRVTEGRENRDIYVRLKRDVDRSREMYQKRVSPSVARKLDYFHDEVVRILGDNDPSTLGSDYPGPLVES